MGKQYDNTNRIVLFRNQRKQQGDNRPSFTGKLNVDGAEFDVSLWTKESREGEKFLSGQITPKEERHAPPPTRQQSRPAPQPEPEARHDDDIPF